MAAMVARNRLERGVKLNHPEAIALITDFVVEGARDGRSVIGITSVVWRMSHLSSRSLRRGEALARSKVGEEGVAEPMGYTPI